MHGPDERTPEPAPSDDVDETSEESFPASDPPGWEPLHLGAPRAARAPRGDRRTLSQRTRMERDRYTYDIEVSPAAAIAGGRYGFVATVVDLRRGHPDGSVERFATPLGQYHGEDAAEAEARAREGVERWIDAQQGR